MIVALFLAALWLALIVWVVTTLNVIRRNTSRTVELLEVENRRTHS